MPNQVPVRNRMDVLAVLRTAKSVELAAKALGFTVTELRSYCGATHMMAAWAKLERGKSHVHPGFKPGMEGTVIADGAGVVEERAENDGHGNARWRILWKACGHRSTVAGIQLRASLKNGDKSRGCPVCREEAHRG